MHPVVMARSFRTAGLLVLVACASAPKSTPRTNAEPVKSDGDADAPLAACGASTIPVLTDYGAARPGESYRIVVRFDAVAQEWKPVTTPRMPLHHASRLAFVNLVDRPELAGLRASPVEMTLVLGSTDIRQVGEREWDAEYHSRIVGVCIPST